MEGLYDAGSEPPQDFYRDKWLTGTKTEMGFAIRHETLDSVKSDRALRDYLKNAASGAVPRVWCRATLTDDIEVFLRHREPRDDEAVLKALHEAEARLSEFLSRKPTEVGGSPRKPLPQKRR